MQHYSAIHKNQLQGILPYTGCTRMLSFSIQETGVVSKKKASDAA